MAISLYDATVLGFQQTVDAVGGFLRKGAEHCQQAGADPEALVETRLHPDMLPLRFQLISVIKHSLGAIEAARIGEFGPPPPPPPVGYAALQAMIAETSAALKAVSRDEVEAYCGRELMFRAGSLELRFTAEDFLLSFSLPNLHFHATTAYDILRMKGVPLGKRDYLGRLRIRT